MSTQAAAILNEAAITAPVIAAFAALVALLDRLRRPETFAPTTAPRVRGPRTGVRRTDRDAPPDPRTVARDAQIVDAWQRGEIPGRHAPGGVR